MLVFQEKIMNKIQETDAAESAGDYHNRGYNCAESIFLTFRLIAVPELSEDMVRMATPFGGGMGRSGCVCGALSGAMMIIGAAKGRTTPEVPRKQSYELANEYHNRFKSKFGATCCRVLVKHDFGTKEQSSTCYKIITESAELLMNFLVEKDIV
jgi:C_GCAxxG_C_C family probable redox protein